MAGLVPAIYVFRVRLTWIPGMPLALCARTKKVRAQPIGISAAPNMTGQARGEGERMAGRHIKARRQCLFRFGHGFADVRGDASMKFC
jgi:hypothetical protein